MSILKRFFTRKYCTECDEIESLTLKCMKRSSENKSLRQNNELLRSLIQWNESSESIYAIHEINGALFVITIEYAVKISVDSPSAPEQFKYELIFGGYLLYNRVLSKPRRRMTTMECIAIYRNEKSDLVPDSLWISDFTMDSDCRNMGLGSKMMQSAIQYAKHNRMSYIAGELSFVDIEDHGERLKHFYTKHGFTISDTGKIRCDLQ